MRTPIWDPLAWRRSIDGTRQKQLAACLLTGPDSQRWRGPFQQLHGERAKLACEKNSAALGEPLLTLAMP